MRDTPITGSDDRKNGDINLGAVMPLLLLLLPCPHDMFIICLKQPLESDDTRIFFSPFDKHGDGFMDKQHIPRRPAFALHSSRLHSDSSDSAELEPSLARHIKSFAHFF